MSRYSCRATLRRIFRLRFSQCRTTIALHPLKCLKKGPVAPVWGGAAPQLYTVYIRYFRNPCDRDPPTRNIKKFKFFKNSLKYLAFTFGERASTFGEQASTFGERASTFWDNRGFRGFWNFFFCCWGVLGLRGSGGPVGVFENI